MALGLVAGFAIGGVIALALLVPRRAGWRSDVAFAPPLLAGALLAVVGGRQLLDAYAAASGGAA